MRSFTTFCLALLLATPGAAKPRHQRAAHRVARRQSATIPSVKVRLKGLGVGMFLWEPTHCVCDCKVKHSKHLASWTSVEQSKHYQSLAKQAAKAKLGFVMVKCHDGTKPSSNYSDKLVKAFRDRGIKVLVWGYNYCIKPDQEAKLINRYLHKPGVLGYVADTEGDTKNRRRAAERMIRLVRQHRDHCPTCRAKLIGYSPLALPSLHRTLPYDVFGTYADFAAPQMYWRTMDRPVKDVIARTFDDWQAWEARQRRAGRAKAIKPLMPVGQAYDHPRYGKVTSAQMAEFLRRTKGYYAVCFWDWQHMSSAKWRALAKAKNWRAVTKPNQRPKKRVHASGNCRSWGRFLLSTNYTIIKLQPNGGENGADYNLGLCQHGKRPT